MLAVADAGSRGADQRGDGVDLGVQHHGDLADQHVTDHAAADPGDHADGARTDHAEAVLQAELSRGDGEQPEARGVQHEVGATQPLDLGVHAECDKSGRTSDRDVGPVPQRERWRQAEQQVAHHAAAKRGDRGKHEHAEQVEPGARTPRPARG